MFRRGHRGTGRYSKLCEAFCTTVELKATVIFVFVVVVVSGGSVSNEGSPGFSITPRFRPLLPVRSAQLPSLSL